MRSAGPAQGPLSRVSGREIMSKLYGSIEDSVELPGKGKDPSRQRNGNTWRFKTGLSDVFVTLITHILKM
jgi:hypothetical protein